MADRYRFAFDLGTNSIGWAVYLLDRNGHPIELVAAGVRIFSNSRQPAAEGKLGESLAMARRQPRAMRRHRDRYLQRRKYLMRELIRAGLMPESESGRKTLETLDPYVLRRRGLDEALGLHEFGRVLFHLNQRRGFQSNRVADKADKDEEGGKIKDARVELESKMKGFRTYGEFLAQRHAVGDSVRIRMEGEGTQAHYDFYPMRADLKAEFRALWDKQAEFHPQRLTGDLRKRLFDIMFFQRPLKVKEPGKCTFIFGEERLPKWHPWSQERRVYQDLNHLRLKRDDGNHLPLSKDQRDRLAMILLTAKKSLTFGQIRRELKLPSYEVFTIEKGDKDDKIIGDEVAARLAFDKGPLQARWSGFTPEQKIDLIEHWALEEDEGALLAYLKTAFGLTQVEAEGVMARPVPPGYSHLGPTATLAILEQLKKDVITYDKAVPLAFPGKHHSDERPEKQLPSLPYYGEILERHTLGGTGHPADTPEARYGRIANPTVHVGLNQIRKVVNALIKAYGNPDEIVLEVARELKQTKDQREAAEKRNKENRRKNEVRAEILRAAGQRVNARGLLQLRLWEELGEPGHICIYSGRPINVSDVLSDRVEIEHILPFSRTLDDNFTNKTLAHRDANRGKRNLSPYEAYRGDPQAYDLIRQRAQVLPDNKRWRFEPDAMDRFEQDFVARQLNETRHLSVLARKYLTRICNDADSVWVVTGQLTSLLRDRFGLHWEGENRKNRDDHRHHALDAIIIGICDRWLMQMFANEAANYEFKDEMREITRRVPQPFFDFHDKVMRIANAIVVSHKPDHGISGKRDPSKTSGALHNETSYGINESEDRIYGELVTRKPVKSLTPGEIEKVRDTRIRDVLMGIKADVGKDLKALPIELEKWSKANRIHRVRILKKQEDFIRIKDRKTGQPYRAVIGGENFCMDVVEDSDGIWKGVAISVFDANQGVKDAWKAVYPGARFLMRLHKGDLLSLVDKDGVRRIKRVVQLEPSSSRMRLAEHNEGGELQKRHDDEDDAFRWDLATISKLRGRECRYVRVDELGRVK